MGARAAAVASNAEGAVPASPRSRGPLAMLDLAIGAYLSLPLLVFVLGTFRPVVAALLGVLVLVAAWPLRRVLRRSTVRVQLPWRGALVVTAIALLWSVAGGSGHRVYAQTDWLKHDAVYADLSRDAWPPTYAETDSGPLVLRYYEAFYVVPSAVTKVVGHHNIVLQAWTSLGVGLFALRLVAAIPRAGRAVAGTLMFVVFGGLDVIGWLWVAGADEVHLDAPVEMWNIVFRDGRGTMVQYSSSSSLLAWVPHHALGGWLATLLLVDRDDDSGAARLAPLLLVVTAFWSVFAAIGLLPFAVLRGIRALRQRSRPLPGLVPGAATLLVGIVVATYLLAGSGQVPQGFVWEFSTGDVIVGRIVVFYVLEVLVVAAAILVAGAAWSRHQDLALAVLLLLPVYSFGLNGDLTMRASIPALLVLFLALRDRLVHPTPISWVRAAPVACVLLVASFTVATLGRDIVALPAERQGLADEADVVNMLAAQDLPAVDQLLAVPPDLLQRALRHNEPRYDVDIVSTERLEDGWDPAAPVAVEQRAGVTLIPSPEGLVTAPTSIQVQPGLYRFRLTVEAPDSALVSLYAGEEQLTRPVAHPPGEARSIHDVFVRIHRSARLELKARDVTGSDARIVVHELTAERWAPRRRG